MKIVPALLFVLSLSAGAASVSAVRTDALKAGKPCVIIAHVDATAL